MTSYLQTNVIPSYYYKNLSIKTITHYLMPTSLLNMRDNPSNIELNMTATYGFMFIRDVGEINFHITETQAKELKKLTTL